MEGQPFILEIEGISKTFGLLKANDEISIQVIQGEILAILGENGAGKSTLMAILFGMLDPDAGEIRFHGQRTHITSPLVALELGIGMVHQHFKLIDRFSAIDNIALGLPAAKRAGLRQDLRQLSQRYGLAVDLDAQAGRLSVGERQKLEILKALNQQVELLILDEPTAVLMPQEVEALLNIVIKLKNEGKTIIFISHKLREIQKIADRCAIIRQGRHVGTYQVPGNSIDYLAQLMVGRKLERPIREARPVGEVRLSCQGLEVANPEGGKSIRGVNLELHAGEIVGMAGVSGNGQLELIAALHGRLPVKSGCIYLNKKEITGTSIEERIQRGLGYIPEDRQRHAVVGELPLQLNLLLKRIGTYPFSRWGCLNFSAIKRHAEQLAQEYDIRSSAGIESLFDSLSGGNQQKAVLAREFSSSAPVLLIEQPTRGLDAAAIVDVHQLLLRQRQQGKAILLVSFELDELIALTDRIVVVADGQISRDLYPPYDEHLIGRLMAGLG